MAALLLAEFRLEEVAHVALRGEAGRQVRQQPSVAGDQPRFEEARVDRHVLRRFVDAFGDGAHAVPRLEAAVPQCADQALDARARLLAVGQQHQEVDVRMGKEQSAAVAAHGNQRDAVALDVIGPEMLQDGIDEGGVGGERAVRVGTFVVTRLQLFAPVANPGAHHRAARAGRDLRRRKGRNRVAHSYETWCAADRSTKDGGGGDPRERVSTSKPPAVTRTVCSHWAESEWSAVTMVQPSASCRMSRLPALIIGSIGEGHPGLEPRALVGAPVVQDLRLFVKALADAVAAEFAHDAVAVALGVALDGEADVAERRTGAHRGDALPHAFVSGLAQPPRLHRGLAHIEHAAGVAVPSRP
jgi:hypothetical protein